MTISNEQPYHVAIIGAGFSGAMLAVHLAKIRPQWRTLVIDKSGSFGPGVAYGTEDLHHLLNLPAGKISAFAEQPDHFLEWLKSQEADLKLPESQPLSPTSFLPRRVYGQYVRDIFNTTRNETPGLEIKEVDIVDIELQGGHLVQTESWTAADRLSAQLEALNIPEPRQEPFSRQHRLPQPAVV